MMSPSRRQTIPESEFEKTFDTVHGAFTLRRPSIQMRRDIHLQAARGLQGLQNVDQIGEALNLMMATVEVCAREPGQNSLEKPLGWPREFGWEKAYDFEWLSELYAAHDTWIQSFRSPRQDSGDKEAVTRGSEKPGVQVASADGMGAE